MTRIKKVGQHWRVYFSPVEVERCRKFGDVTPQGIVFHWELAGSSGADFCLIPEPQHTPRDIEEAKSWIRRTRDALSITIGYIGE